MPAMRPTTIRFPESLWRMIEDESEAEGVSASEFIRASILASILIRRATVDRQIGVNWERAVREASALLEQED